MKESIRVQITQEDIEDWLEKKTCDPLLSALNRATETPWRLAEINCAVERVAPYRTMILRSEVLSQYRAHKISHTPTPFEFESELISPFRD